jgi:L-ascorbate metabolism protein UlaG (beta-lactamase superfamily)
MMPEQTVQAAIELRAKLLLPVHWGKFVLSLHPWDEPIRRVCARAVDMKQAITSPMIGEPVILNETYPTKAWWQDMH